MSEGEQTMRGRVHRFGPNINTDDIIAGKYKHRTIEPDELAPHLMENIRPEFAAAVRPGDFLVAGANFGCGSSREQAPQLLRHVGLSAVVAPSFARIFYRNALNIGLLLVVAETEGVAEGDLLEFDAAEGLLRVTATGWSARTEPLPAALRDLVAHGGLLNLVRAGGFR
jgi:3-isopropylmalate/(R)-2-methylmalate dehydratase small subunit